MAEISTPPAISTILLNPGSQAHKPIEGKVETAMTIKPGMLIEKTVTGAYQYGTYQPHGTAGGNAEKIVCVEWGMPVDIPFSSSFKTGTINDEFGEGEHIFAHLCQPGDEVALLIQANSAAVDLEDFLESAGDGTVEKLASGVPLFKALEAVTPGATDSFIRARAL